MSDIEPTIHNQGFTPRKSGRTPLVDVNELIAVAAKHQGKWISKKYTNKEAQSVAGQLKRKGYEVVSNAVDADHREVYVRYSTGSSMGEAQ